MTLHPPKRRRSSAPPPVVATSNDGVLPLDLLYDVLLRLPAETLCRFRAVCRSWRSLLSHPDFIAAARNPGPLIALGITDYYSSRYEVSVLDMDSGDTVTRVNIAANDLTYGEAHSISPDGVGCILGPQHRIRLLDLPNGSVFLLPDRAPPRGHKLIWCTVGGAASTLEHKVLAITTFVRHEPFVCKILTLGLSNGGWRDIGSPPWALTGGVTVINGVAYFLSRYHYAKSKESYVYRQIMAFDFNKEAWRSTSNPLRGPANCHRIISLADLDSHLVACHADHLVSIQLWFLMDSDRSLWFKRYTINMPCHQTVQTHQPQMCYTNEYLQKPLAVLDDGRIVMWMRVIRQGYSVYEEVLRIYNPRTKTFKDGTVVPYCNHMRLFTWNLLHTGQRGALDDAARRQLVSRRHH